MSTCCSSLLPWVLHRLALTGQAGRVATKVVAPKEAPRVAPRATPREAPKVEAGVVERVPAGHSRRAAALARTAPSPTMLLLTWFTRGSKMHCWPRTSRCRRCCWQQA